MRQAQVSGTSSGIATAWVALTTVSSTNTDVLANWNAFSPPTVKGRLSLPSSVRQNVGLPRSHAAQCAAVAERGQHHVVADLHVGDVVGDLPRRCRRPRGPARPASGT